MCGRFALVTSADEIKSQFKVAHVPEITVNYNIAPTQPVLILMRAEDTPFLDAEWFTWGLVPYYSKDKKISPPLINARAETAAVKPAFRSSFSSKRGVILMSGYFEWQQLTSHKQPYYIKPINHELLAVAALWDSWQSKEGEIMHSCCMITTEANEQIASFHNRMPALLTPVQQMIWLDGACETGELQEVLKPSSVELRVYPVTPKMNNWRYTDADAIRPLNPS